jgi:hypothetical protein
VKNLLYKEFKLSVQALNYLFLAMALMLLIPNYPYEVAFFYQTLGVFFIFMLGNTNNDLFFTALLPVRKQDAVRARFATVIIFELLQMVISVPFALLRSRLNGAANQAGVEASFTLFGVAFVMYGVFNLIFLPMFYKTGYKTGIPFLVSGVAVGLVVVVAEAAINLVPGWKVALDSIEPAYLPQRLLAMAGGLMIFVILTALAYKLSVERFERLDL